MKLFIPNIEKLTTTIGGGNTFAANFIKYLPQEHEIVDSISKADIFFIIGPTTCSRDEFKEARELGKKIVLRLDGVPENWRNRGTGIPRMLDFAKDSDLIIYQSDFVKHTVLRMIKQKVEKNLNYKKIYNGVDTEIFNDKKTNNAYKYLHVHYRKDPNKRFEEVIHRFRDQWLDNKQIELWLVGRIPTMFKDYDFGFFNGENVKYYGVVNDREALANIMQQAGAIIYPAYADPSPNTLLEALHCGCRASGLNQYGGSFELYKRFSNGFDFSMERCMKQYLSTFTDLLNE